MKRLLIILASLFLLSCLTGCVAGSGAESKPVEQSGEGSFGDYYVKITDHFITTTYNGKNVLVLCFDFTNNGEDAASAASSLSVLLFQRGIELSSAYFLFPPPGYDGTNFYTKIKDGATLNCQKAFYLRSLTAPVEVEINRYFSFGSNVVSAELDIANTSQPNE